MCTTVHIFMFFTGNSKLELVDIWSIGHGSGLTCVDVCACSLPPTLRLPFSNGFIPHESSMQGVEEVR